MCTKRFFYFIIYFKSIIFVNMKNPESELIALTLTNIVNVDSEVDLFSYGTGGTSTNNTTTYYVVEFVFAVLKNVIGDVNGTPFSITYGQANMPSFVSALNSGDGIFAGNILFTYELVGGTTYRLIGQVLTQGYSLSYISTSFDNFFFSGYSVPVGTTVSITTGTSITYGELLSELQNQPYIINSINVYANTKQQSMQRLKKIKRTMSGVSATDFNRPRLDPMQSQFAIEHIDANFTPSPINILNYNMKGLESVRMWFYYDRIDISEINQKKFNEIIEPKTINKMIKISKSINPLFDLVGTKQERQITIKEKLAPTIENRDVTDEEVYNSFDGLDFKELE